MQFFGAHVYSNIIYKFTMVLTIPYPIVHKHELNWEKIIGVYIKGLEFCFFYYCAVLWCAQIIDTSEGIELLNCLSDTFSRVCV